MLVGSIPELMGLRKENGLNRDLTEVLEAILQ